MQTTLFLVLKREPFQQIASGEKTSEYRDYSDYWVKRLMKDTGEFKPYTRVLFQNGYRKDAPRMLVELKTIVLKKKRCFLFLKPAYFELVLGGIIEKY